MYKIYNYLSPLHLKQIFNNFSIIHTHNLRNFESNYFIPRPRTEYAKGSLHYRGFVLWNRIPLEMRHLPHLNNFKTAFHGEDYNELT